MNNIFKKLTVDELKKSANTATKPKTINPYAPLNTGIYTHCQILKVFIRKSTKSDAHFADVTFRIPLGGGESVDKTLSLLVTNSKGSSITQTGGYLKGFTLLNNLSLLTTDSQIAELSPQPAVSQIYGQQVAGQCFPQLENSYVALLLIKYREPRQVVKDPKYPYREDNEIFEILSNDSCKTYEELLGNVEEPRVLNYFKDKYSSEYVQERTGWAGSQPKNTQVNKPIKNLNDFPSI